MSKRVSTPTCIKNGIKYYYKRLELGINPKTGKRLRKTFYGKTVKEINDKISAYKIMLDNNIKVVSNETFGEYMEYWIKEVHFNKGLKLSTMERYWGLYNNYIKNVTSFIRAKKSSNLIDHDKLLIYGIPLNKLTARNIQDYFNTLKNNNISIATIHSISKIIKPCLINAYATDKIHKDYSIGLVLPKKNSSSSSITSTEELSIFSRDETLRFFKSIKDTRDEVLYTVAAGVSIK